MSHNIYVGTASSDAAAGGGGSPRAQSPSKQLPVLGSAGVFLGGGGARPATARLLPFTVQSAQAQHSKRSDQVNVLQHGRADALQVAHLADESQHGGQPGMPSILRPMARAATADRGGGGGSRSNTLRSGSWWHSAQDSSVGSVDMARQALAASRGEDVIAAKRRSTEDLGVSGSPAPPGWPAAGAPVFSSGGGAGAQRLASGRPGSARPGSASADFKFLEDMRGRLKDLALPSPAPPARRPISCRRARAPSPDKAAQPQAAEASPERPRYPFGREEAAQAARAKAAAKAEAATRARDAAFLASLPQAKGMLPAGTRPLSATRPASTVRPTSAARPGTARLALHASGTRVLPSGFLTDTPPSWGSEAAPARAGAAGLVGQLR